MTAQIVCCSVRALVHESGLEGIVLAAVHSDVMFWLMPQWAFHVPHHMASRLFHAGWLNLFGLG